MKFIRVLKSNLQNLNSEGFKIANTDSELREFWKWFNGSKLVDTEGRPIPVFHGTTANIEFFDEKNNNLKMIFFSTSMKTAYTYGNNLKVAYLKMINPKIIDMDYHDYQGRKTDFSNNKKDLAKKNKKPYNYLLILKAKREGHDSVIFKNILDNSGFGQTANILDDFSDVCVVFNVDQIKIIDIKQPKLFDMHNEYNKFIIDVKENLPKEFGRIKQEADKILKSVNDKFEVVNIDIIDSFSVSKKEEDTNIYVKIYYKFIGDKYREYYTEEKDVVNKIIDKYGKGPLFYSKKFGPIFAYFKML